jgi:hypothetical protein
MYIDDDWTFKGLLRPVLGRKCLKNIEPVAYSIGIGTIVNLAVRGVI